MNVEFKRLTDDAVTPTYATDGDAGLDLYANEETRIEVGQSTIVSTGVAIAIPYGYAGFVHPRSGLAAKSGLTVLNAPGTIDSGYRGELKVILINHHPEKEHIINKGDRIAQLIIQPVVTAHLEEVSDFQDKTERGAGGFGSTGQ